MAQTKDRNSYYKDLFSKLDTNKDGVISLEELAAAFGSAPVDGGSGAQRLMTASDADSDGSISFVEFSQYLDEHERKLFIEFKRIDKNDDNVLDTDDIVAAFGKLGIEVGQAEAVKLLQKMDKDKTDKISWDEWRDFLLLNATTDLQEILDQWRLGALIDIGESLAMPKDYTKEELQTGLWWRHLVAGGVAGAVSRTATAPLDRLKVMLQVHGSQEGNRMGVVSGFKSMLKEGGVRSLWRGNGVNVIKIAPESAMKFMAYEEFKKMIKNAKGGGELTALERFEAGAAAGATAQTVIYPMEVLKTRLAVAKTGQYRGMADCAVKLYKSEGIRSFYRGYIPNIAGVLPYAGIDLMVYEQLKKLYTGLYPSERKEPSVWVLLLCGTASSTAGQFVSYPLALVRTRMQAAATSAGGARVGAVAMIRSVVAREGLAGLYRGIFPNFLKVAPAVSISYAVYESAKVKLGI